MQMWNMEPLPFRWYVGSHYRHFAELDRAYRVRPADCRGLIYHLKYFNRDLSISVFFCFSIPIPGAHYSLSDDSWKLSEKWPQSNCPRQSLSMSNTVRVTEAVACYDLDKRTPDMRNWFLAPGTNYSSRKQVGCRSVGWSFFRSKSEESIPSFLLWPICLFLFVLFQEVFRFFFWLHAKVCVGVFVNWMCFIRR